jgi:hypothetical protein
MKEIIQHPYSFELIPARLFTVNRNYQRDAQNKEINDIIANFDYHLVNPVKAVKRDGLYYIWDGQQTATALGWTQVKISREEKKILAALRLALS